MPLLELVPEEPPPLDAADDPLDVLDVLDVLDADPDGSLDPDPLSDALLWDGPLPDDDDELLEDDEQSQHSQSGPAK